MKNTQIANTISDVDGDGRTDNDNTVGPFHHFSNVKASCGGGGGGGGGEGG